MIYNQNHYSKKTISNYDFESVDFKFYPTLAIADQVTSYINNATGRRYTCIAFTCVQLDATERCWSVVLKRVVTVSNTRPASVHVYDYYEPGLCSSTVIFVYLY